MAIVIDGNNTPTAGGVGYGDGTELAFTAAGTSGRPVVSGGSGAPTFRPYTLPAADGSANQILQTDGLGALSFATPGGLVAATQAQMETATSNTVAATPSNTNFHPGVAKCWGRASGDGATLNVSHNVTSITDAGTGQLTVTIATDFSSQYYSVCAVAGADSGARMIGTNNVNIGTFALQSYNDAGTLTDPGSYSWACFGDQ